MFKPNRKTKLKEAVDLWCENQEIALEKYGPINTWDTSKIKDMSRLFENKTKFNDDIGSWDSLERVREADESGNIVSGDAVIFDTSESVIFNESLQNKKIVSAFGLDNVVIVVTDDAILVCPKDRVQEVKKSVETIRDKFGNDWL